MDTAGVGRGGGRKHAAREFHTFPVHDDDAEFPSDVMHDTDFSDYSSDSDSPIGTQVPVDYSNVELLHHHRRGYEAAAAGGSSAAEGAWSAGADVGVGNEAPACGSGSSLRSGPPLTRRPGARCRHQPVRVYTNPSNAGARRTQRHQRHHESSHGLPQDENSRPLHTGLETLRVSSQQTRRRTGLWTDQQLREALAAVNGGMSMRKAAATYSIPYSTFREWCYGIRTSRKKGPPTVLKPAEEEELVNYLIQMCDKGYGLTPSALRMKVYEITQSRWTPFRNGIPGNGWMRWWKRRHPNLTLRVSQALESARARGLCAENVRSLYENLQHLYSLHQYSPDRIWNCDESGAQAGRNGSAIVIARRGARRVHSIVPNQREWLSVLVCINAAGTSIPSFYIFRGRRFRQNYIEKCEAGATMAMQQRAWMTSYLFSAWISHFIASVRRVGDISPQNRHLLILDGHNSHVTLDVVREASAAGLDLMTLPAHTSHALQPLDVAVFKPFKQHFREYRDFWSSRNLDESATKDVLSQWVSLALRKALSASNIKKGFSATGIFPLNFHAVDSHLLPSEVFTAPDREAEHGHGGDEEQGGMAAYAGNEGQPETGGEDDVPSAGVAELEADLAKVPDSNAEHFFVDADPSNEATAAEVLGLEGDPDGVESITRFLTLPTVAQRVNARHRDPIMDFSKSIMLTSEQYISAAAHVQEAKASAARQKEIARQEKEERRKRKEIQREEERKAKEARAAELAEARTQKQAERKEARAMREARTAEAAHARALKAAEREHAQRLKVERAMQVADDRARREAEKARRASDVLARATERVQGHQIPGMQAAVTAPHLQFPGFVTHVTSTMHHPPPQLPQHHRNLPIRPLAPPPYEQANPTPERGHPFNAHVASGNDRMRYQ